MPGSNRRPPACKAGALPTELTPRSRYCSVVAAIGSSLRRAKRSVRELPESLLPETTDGSGRSPHQALESETPEGPSAVLVIRGARPRPHPHRAKVTMDGSRHRPARIRAEGSRGPGARRPNSATAPTCRALRLRVPFRARHRRRLAPAERGDKLSGGSEPSDSVLRGGPGSWGTRSLDLTARGTRSS